LDGAVSFCVTRCRTDRSSRWARPELIDAANVRAAKVTTEKRLIWTVQAIGAIVGMFDLHNQNFSRPPFILPTQVCGSIALYHHQLPNL
jgi:hypothetical protein